MNNDGYSGQSQVKNAMTGPQIQNSYREMYEVYLKDKEKRIIFLQNSFSN